jgi:hypothetical protein
VYDLITGKILKELSTIWIQYLTQLFSAVLLKGYFPAQWKVAQIILIPKPWTPSPLANILSPNKPPTHHIKSSRKISLKKTPPNSGKNQLILNHQFCFSERHYTIEQTQNCTTDKLSPGTQTVLFCITFRHHPSIRQSMTHWITVQVKTISPFELFPYAKILPAEQTFPH